MSSQHGSFGFEPVSSDAAVRLKDRHDESGRREETQQRRLGHLDPTTQGDSKSHVVEKRRQHTSRSRSIQQSSSPQADQAAFKIL
jgi:hypothetical protein